MKKFKAIFKILLVLFVVALIVISIIQMQNRECSNIQVNINYSGKNPPLTQAHVISLLQQDGVSILGTKLKEVPNKEITEILMRNNFIKEVRNIRFKGTTLVITLQLKNLLLHIYPEKGEQYFMDDEMGLIPYSPLVRENLLVANGDIKKRYTKEKSVNEEMKQLVTLFELASAIERDPFSKAQYCQIYVNQNQDIELIPRIGKHTIYFGKGDRINEKLNYLENVYSDVLAYQGMDQYRELDVRFQDRVIAKKR